MTISKIQKLEKDCISTLHFWRKIVHSEILCNWQPYPADIKKCGNGTIWSTMLKVDSSPQSISINDNN